LRNGDLRDMAVLRTRHRTGDANGAGHPAIEDYR
jgi:hypothetical protein